MAQRSSSVGQLRGCDRASGVRVMYGVCSELRYKVMGPTVRREDLLKNPFRKVPQRMELDAWFLSKNILHQNQRSLFSPAGFFRGNINKLIFIFPRRPCLHLHLPRRKRNPLRELRQPSYQTQSRYRPRRPHQPPHHPLEASPHAHARAEILGLPCWRAWSLQMRCLRGGASALAY